MKIAFAVTPCCRVNYFRVSCGGCFSDICVSVQAPGTTSSFTLHSTLISTTEPASAQVTLFSRTF